MSKPRQRINPFDRATAEHVLFDRYRRAKQSADTAQAAANRWQEEASAFHAKAQSYVEALRALGHGDKVPGLSQAVLTAAANAMTGMGYGK